MISTANKRLPVRTVVQAPSWTGNVIAPVPAELCPTRSQPCLARLCLLLALQGHDKQMLPLLSLAPLLSRTFRSYETLRKYAGEMQGTFDLLVCDEGHRWGAGSRNGQARSGIGHVMRSRWCCCCDAIEGATGSVNGGCSCWGQVDSVQLERLHS